MVRSFGGADCVTAARLSSELNPRREAATIARMRLTALGLLALAGCNEFWGLGDVRLKDGGGFVDGDPDNPRIRLTSQITRTRDQGFADPMLDYAPLDPPPSVQLGRIGEALEAADYGPDGTVKYPVALAGSTWRLVYTLADGIPREVHWSPPAGDLVAHIVEPLLGRPQRLPVPPGSGYRITPTGSPGQHTLSRVFTTGIWTEGETPMPLPGATFDYDFGAKAQSLSGPRGAPESAAFDHAVLADFQNLNGCRVATGVATFVVPDLVAGMLSPPDPQPPYFGPDKQAILDLAGPDPVDTRLQDVLGARASGANLDRMEYGYVPSLGVFGFSKPVPEQSLGFFLPGPRMIAFADCRFTPGLAQFQTPTFADPPELRGRFPHVVHVEVANQRTVSQGLVTLTSGFSAVLASSSYQFTSEFLVAAPTRITLHRGGSQIADLENDADGTALPPGTGLLELRLEVEIAPNLGVDYFDVTLYSIPNNKLDRQRVYTVTERTLMLDPSFLVPDTEYVFEVRAYRGRPEITRANFAANTYPQYAATIFTRTFRTPPSRACWGVPACQAGER